MLIKKPDAKKIDLGSKKITKYTSGDKKLEVNIMEVEGRHPGNINHFVFEEKVHFMMYILQGSGKVYLNEEVYEVKEGDVVDVSPKDKFAVEGNFKYLAAQTPAWEANQAFIVDRKGDIVEDTKK